MTRAGDRLPTAGTTPRRNFLVRAATWLMAGSLAAGYGLFGWIAGRYLYPARPARRAWMFVSDLPRFPEGGSLLYTAPSGETVNITRQGNAGTVDDFIALSSVCPHLGCQVHWQVARQRFFCPCHNGTFDAGGRGTSGPPGDAGMSLPRFPLRVEGGLLYIEVPVDGLASPSRAAAASRTRDSRRG